MTRRSLRCHHGSCSLGALCDLHARHDALTFSCSAGATHDVQVAMMSLWWLLPGSSACSSCPPRCACVQSLGAGDARRAGCAVCCDVVVAAAPWELRVFFVPATMCSRSVAWRGGCMTRRSHSLLRCCHGGCSLGAPCVLCARQNVPAFGHLVWVTHNAQIAHVTMMSSWLSWELCSSHWDQKLSQASCCKMKLDGSGAPGKGCHPGRSPLQGGEGPEGVAHMLIGT
jgi:hypothetical protein